MIDKRWRSKVEAALRPVGRGLHRIGVTPDALTIIGLLASCATAWLVATGHLWWAVVGLVATGLPDVLDGSVARNSGRAGPRGSFFDSVADRLSDAILLGGVAWYLGGKGPHLPVLAFAVAAVSMTISYERAKAESLGLEAKGGLLERAERLILLGIGFAFNVIVPVLWIMLVLGSVTVVTRFVKVWRQAGRPAGAPPRRETRVTRPVNADGSPRPFTDTLATWWDARRPSPARRERARAQRRTRP
ncbi:MAG: CDP-alcohol phosphatidyltransferase family protein [Acidimicrobiia bacterium]